MITYDEYSQRAPCSTEEFETAYTNAKNKLAVIVSRFGDDNGARLTDNYFEQLIIEELRVLRLSKIMFSVFFDRVENR